VPARAASRPATGDFNSFFGNLAGAANTSGEFNSFFGTHAGASNTSAEYNSFFGFAAGLDTLGKDNSFFGGRAGEFNTTGENNSFFGYQAGLANSKGENNSFFGRAAGIGNLTGQNNTAIGNFADMTSGNLDHATAIGADARVSTSNTILLGRTNGSDKVRVPGLGVAGATALCRNTDNEISTCSSSLRYKKNLQYFTRGLSLLNQLNPITFRWKADDSADLGFGAEDIAAIEPLLVTHNDKGEVEGVKYDRITAVLVNAVKEQQEQIKQQQNQIAGLKQLVCRRHSRAAVCK
jgi:hypothetical protein